MISSPFSLFLPYTDRLHIQLCTKADAINGDAALRTLLTTDRLVSLRQVHGNRTIIVREPTSRTEQTDGLITATPGLFLTIRTADCQSILAFDPVHNILGILHCGWRGLVNGAIPAFIKTFTNHFQTNPEDLLIGCGPSLCKHCAEFSDPHTELAGIPDRFFTKTCADLPAVAHWQLMESGVKKQHIERSPDCTKCKNETYWSYRGTDHSAVKEGWTNVLTGVLLR